MPIHLISSLVVPEVVLQRLERIFVEFLLGESGRKNKRKWVAWDSLVVPTSEGGLGLRSLDDVKKAFFMKKAWNVLTKNSIRAKYFREKYFIGNFPLSNPSFASKFWNHILYVMDLVEQHSSWCVGRGEVDFWSSKWVGSSTIKEVEDIDTNQTILIRDVCIGGRWHWDLLHVPISESLI
ncbi:hypothetical protein IFM89_013084 [Coptis chinensis]|uniref:Uncharacterized protein n=1 Tax=Coptis chinensis TaxID=261450 RepID=A0A835LRJ4_9MAGN|nr:hypothetical protein IFM89_013084 [Coptis chinensis]